MKLADRMDCLGTETAFAVSAEASNLEAKGVKIYPFHLGDINLETPKTIRSAALEAIESGKTGYCPAPGIIELRKALAEDVSNSRNVKYTSNNVSVQSGGKPVISKFIMSKMNPGDRVLYPNPGYPIYESQIEFYGGIACPYGYINTTDGLRLDFTAIENGIEKGAKHIFYNNYNNPTGASSSISEMKKLAALCISNDLFLFSDEAYFDTLFEGESHSIVSMPNMRERSLILYTFSKKFAMTGWRLGWSVWPEKLVEHVIKFCVNNHSCVNAAIQYGAISALDGPEDSIHSMVKKFILRKNLMVDGLKKIKGIVCNESKAGFFIFPNIKGIGMNGDEFSTRCLNEAGVALIPGTAFGKFAIDNVRLNFTTSEENISNALEKINNMLG